jgi:hypothetical protein
MKLSGSMFTLRLPRQATIRSLAPDLEESKRVTALMPRQPSPHDGA